MRVQLPTLLAVGMLAGACATDQVGPQNALETLTTGTIFAPTTVTHEAIVGLPPGFECPVVPNGFNPLASIYRRDKDGIHYQVIDLSTDPNIAGKKRTFRIADYTLSDEQIGSSKLSATLVRSALPGLSASASANTNSTKAIGITVKDLTGEVINDRAEDYIIEWFKKNIKPRAGSRYFIVREAIKAGSVSYSLKDKDVAKLGGAAEIQNIANGKADVTVRDNQGRLEIEQKFKPRISVCTKRSEIAVHAAVPASSAGTARVAPKPIAAQ